jgi:hypothetical protein
VVRASDSGTLDFICGHENKCYSHPIASAHRQLGWKRVVLSPSRRLGVRPHLCRTHPMVVRWSLLQAHLHPVWVALPLSSQGRQTRELVDLSLWNPETGRLLADLLLWMRQWNKFLGRLCNNWKWRWHGGDRFGDSGAASLSTANAGFPGVSGGLSLSGIVEQLSYRVDLLAQAQEGIFQSQ